MTPKAWQKHLKDFEAKLISPTGKSLWERGASEAAYHYLCCAKTLALIGKAFAEANLAMMKQARAARP